MWLALTIAGSLLLGWELAARLWPATEPDAPRLMERTLYSFAMGSLLWLASSWTLALLQLLRHPFMMGRTVAFGTAALLLMVIRLRGRRGEASALPRLTWLSCIAAAPFVLWIGFVLWRGAIVPVLSHDALSYHLPRAALHTRAGGYQPQAEREFLIPARPANYEVLLADAITLDGSDDVTEWISTLFYVLFVAGVAALAEQWWRPGQRALFTTALVAASAPLLLLQSSAHKNDLMLSAFAGVALVSAGRYLLTAERAALFLALASLAAVGGTKVHGLVLVAWIGPLLLWKIFASGSAARRLGEALLAGLLAVVCLGGAAYVARLQEPGSDVAEAQAGLATPAADPGGTYGDWSNVWQGTYVLMAAPFSPNPLSLRVPWGSGSLFWRRYELYFSHLGVGFALAALAFPWALFRLARRDDAMRRVRLAITLAGVGALVVLLPVHFRPSGLYLINLPRFVLFIVPIILAWTLSPAVDALAARRADLALLAASLLFVVYAVDTARHDAFAPLRYVLWASSHPGTRVIPFDPDRSTSVVDRMAGPGDRILIDPGRYAWIYPAFGEQLSREVRLIPPGQGTPLIPGDADWVVVERGWNAVWGHSGFNDMTNAGKYIGQGAPTESDLRVLRALAGDPRFRLEYLDRVSRQAVFRRLR